MEMNNVSEALVVILQFENSIGIFLNVFILFVISHGFVKGEKVGSNSRLLFAVSISNVSYSIMFTCMYFGQSDSSAYSQYILSSMLLYSITSCAWLTACLCFFYFIKVVQFSCSILAWVNRKIDSIIPWLIMVAEVGSLVSSFIYMVVSNDTADQLSSKNTSVILSLNMTPGTNTSKSDFDQIIFASCGVPFLIIFVTTAWTGGFLWQHIHRMKKNMGTSGGTPLKPQRKAANTMMRFLVFYTVFYFSIGTNVFQLIPPNPINNFIHLVLGCSFTPVQSVLLIFASSRLKKAWKQMSLFIQCHKILRNALLNY
ncbi:taste receptor type 2 member 116-like [Pelodytes ibericus]